MNEHEGVMAEVFNRLEYEVERLKEIYGYLFPDQTIVVFIKPESDKAHENCREISLASAHDLLSFSKFNSEKILIGDPDKAPSRAFLVTADIANTYESAEIGRHQSIGFKYRFKHAVRSFLLNFPVLYELLKSLYFSRKNKERHVFDRIININNPKNRMFKGVESDSAFVSMHWMDVGGAESYAVQSINELHGKGFSVSVISAHLSRRFHFPAIAGKAKVYELDRQVPPALHVIFFARLAYGLKPAIIHNHHNIVFYESLPALNKLSNSRLIDSLHLDEKPRHAYGYPRISVVWSNFIDIHHVISDRLSKLLISKGVHSARVIYGRLGGEICIPHAFNIEQSMLKKEINFCFVGRMVTQKRPLLAISMLLRAVKFFESSGKKVKVQIVGDGFYLDAMRRAVYASGLHERFIFHAPGVSVKSVMDDSDILLVSSENEGITLVAYEALRSGVMVVSTDVGAQSEIVPRSLLLPELPLPALRAWRDLLPRLLDPNIRLKMQNEIKEKALTLSARPTAESVMASLYEGKI